jgi:hypothetical protein
MATHRPKMDDNTNLDNVCLRENSSDSGYDDVNDFPTTQTTTAKGDESELRSVSFDRVFTGYSDVEDNSQENRSEIGENSSLLPPLNHNLKRGELPTDSSNLEASQEIEKRKKHRFKIR